MGGSVSSDASENNVVFNGNRYVAYPKHVKDGGGVQNRSCYDCVFMGIRKSTGISLCSQVPCMSDERKDKTNVYFK